VLQSWANGVQLDLRVKLAVDFLKAGLLVRREEGAFPLTAESARLVAEFAVDVAGSLLDVAVERGLMKDLPDDDELTAMQRRHLRRATRAQIYAQVVSQVLGREEQGELPPQLDVARITPGRGIA